MPAAWCRLLRGIVIYLHQSRPQSAVPLFRFHRLRRKASLAACMSGRRSARLHLPCQFTMWVPTKARSELSTTQFTSQTINNPWASKPSYYFQSSLFSSVFTMHLLCSVVAVAIYGAKVVQAAPAALAARSDPPTYPLFLNTTDTAFYLHVKSNNPLIDGHNVQLRPTGGNCSPQIVVVDATSPVASFNMTNGFLYSQSRTLENQEYNLGPVSHLKNVSVTESSGNAEFYFQNATNSDKGTGGFMLELVGGNAVYGLYHYTAVEIVNGFIICEATNGTYHQLFYTQYYSDPSSIPGCEFVGVQVGSSSIAIFRSDAHHVPGDCRTNGYQLMVTGMMERGRVAVTGSVPFKPNSPSDGRATAGCM